MNLNKVILMGRLCADPEFRMTQNGVASCRIRIAINRQFANKQTGEREADFISVSCWRQTAEFVNRYFRKGSVIIVEGSLRNNDWTDQSGVKHYSMDVLAERVGFGESKNAAQTHGSGYANTTSQQNYTVPSSTVPPSVPSPQNTPYAAPVQNAQMGLPDALGDLSDFEEILSDGAVPF